jgi:hypothetical protein
LPCAPVWLGLIVATSKVAGPSAAIAPGTSGPPANAVSGSKRNEKANVRFSQAVLDLLKGDLAWVNARIEINEEIMTSSPCV